MPETMHASEFEKKLGEFYSTPAPDPDFAARLETRLAERAKAMKWETYPEPVKPRPFLQSLFHRPIFAVAFSALLLMFIAISIIGPKTVLAGVQRLFGYAPNAGFVQPGETLILAAPIEQKQGDVTLRVESVVADTQHTQIVLTASGLPHEKFGPMPETPRDQQPRLDLPDGTKLYSDNNLTGIGDVLQSSLSFPAIPAGVDHFTLVLPRLPSLPAGYAPENWSVSIQLQSTSTTAQPSTGGVTLTQPYMPVNALVEVNGVTANVVQVAQGSAETGIQVQFSWKNDAWKWLSELQIHMEDENGKVYPRIQPTLGPAFEPGNLSAKTNGDTATYRFAPLDPQAKKAVLVIDQMMFSVVSNAHFRFDPGKNAQIGETWDLSQQPDSRLNIAGMPVQVLSATIKDAPKPAPANTGKGYLLEILVQAPPTYGLAVDSLGLSIYPDRGMSSSSEMLPEDRFRLTIELPELPKQPLDLYLPSDSLKVTGPWRSEWSLP